MSGTIDHKTALEDAQAEFVRKIIDRALEKIPPPPPYKLLENNPPYERRRAISSRANPYAKRTEEDTIC